MPDFLSVEFFKNIEVIVSALVAVIGLIGIVWGGYKKFSKASPESNTTKPEKTFSSKGNEMENLYSNQQMLRLSGLLAKVYTRYDSTQLSMLLAAGGIPDDVAEQVYMPENGSPLARWQKVLEQLRQLNGDQVKNLVLGALNNNSSNRYVWDAAKEIGLDPAAITKK